MAEVVERHPGGNMSGVFGAGYVSYWEMNPEHRKFVKPILRDCSSAGAINVAYELSGNAIEGSTIYTDFLPGNFVFPGRVIPGIGQRIWNRIIYGLDGQFGLKPISRDKLLKPVDIEYFFKVMKEEVKLNVENIKQSKVPFMVRVFDTKTCQVELKDARNNPWDILRKAVTVMPFDVPLENQTETDADMVQVLGLESLLRRYPNNKIMIILNHKPKREWFHYAFHFTEGAVASTMVPGNGYNVFKSYNQKARIFMEDISKLRQMEESGEALLIYPRKEPLPPDAKDRRIFWVHPSEKSETQSNTSDKLILRGTWKDGTNAAKAVYELFSN